MWYKDQEDFDNHLLENIDDLCGKEQLIISPKVYNDMKIWDGFEIKNNESFYKGYSILIINEHELIKY